MYCRASDHDTEECLTLLVKIQEKRNQNNQNVQWISAEARDEGWNINIVTRGGAKTGNDAVRQEPVQNQWVKKNTEPRKQFDVQKEKEIFKEARQEFQKEDIASTSTAQHNKEAPEYEMPPSLDHTNGMQPMGQVSTIKGFLQSCVKVLSDPSSVKILQNILEKCSIETEGKLEPKTVNHLHTRRRTSREFRLNANIGDFNMGDIILDLGSEVNVLPKKTWQCMGEPTLGYSPVQLKLANQHRVLPIGRLKGVTVDLDGVCTKEDFEVIEIVDDTTPYPTLLGLDWAFDNQAIINLKTRKMTFESGEYRVIAPLDPSEGERFVEPTCLDLEEIGQLYRTTARDEDYVNPTADGVLSWRSITSCATDSDTGLENWQQRLHEVSMRRCARIDRAVRWVGTEIREPPSFHGINDLETFLTQYEDAVLENQRLLALDLALKATPARWWGAHKETITDWYQCKRLLRIRFGAEQKNNKQQKYDGHGAPTEHLEACRTLWKMTPPEEWPHHFIHTLEGIPANWYTDQELRKGTATWTTLQQNFTITFSFEHENPNIDAALKQIRGVIFIKEPDIEVITEEKQWNKQTVKELLSCYHVQEEAPDEDDLCDIQIEEAEGERDVEGPPIESKVISCADQSK
jgi:hypothetical protein